MKTNDEIKALFEKIAPHLSRTPQTSVMLATLAGLDVTTTELTLIWARSRGMVGWVSRTWEDRFSPYRYVRGSAY